MSERFLVIGGRRIYDSVTACFVSTDFLGRNDELRTMVAELNYRIATRQLGLPVLINGDEYRERKAEIQCQIRKAGMHSWPF